MAICINSFYVKKLDVEDERAIIDNYYVYGQYLSLEGHIDNIDVSYDKLDLVLYNGSFREYDLAVDGDSDGIRFSLDKDINRGIYLDDIERGKYNLFIRALYIDEDKSDDDKKVYDYK